jgi:hypothetical protein
MTPTLIGRWQTRVALLGTVGVLWTLLLVPFLPRHGAALTAAYRTGFTAIAITIVIGVIAWDPIYHGLQQFRWEKDWPTLYALLNGVNEAVTTWLLLRALRPAVATGPFVAHFATTWILVWLVTIGPIRVVLLRRRFIGGRVLGA